jgi:uncharacterized protein
MTEFLLTPAKGHKLATLLLAHGAGAPMDSDFMNLLSDALAQRGIEVWRFEFPYMARRRHDGVKRPPDRAPVLLQEFSAAMAKAGGGGRVYIGGKSMGGRMASLLATEQACRGVICFGYPFHPPGKPDNLRIEHFPDVKAPLMICHGERDPFGKRDEVVSWSLPDSVVLHWVAQGDHDFKAPLRSGLLWAQQIDVAAEAVRNWLERSSKKPL